MLCLYICMLIYSSSVNHADVSKRSDGYQSCLIDRQTTHAGYSIIEVNHLTTSGLEINPTANEAQARSHLSNSFIYPVLNYGKPWRYAECCTTGVLQMHLLKMYFIIYSDSLCTFYRTRNAVHAALWMMYRSLQSFQPANKQRDTHTTHRDSHSQSNHSQSGLLQLHSSTNQQVDIWAETDMKGKTANSICSFAQYRQLIN